AVPWLALARRPADLAPAICVVGFGAFGLVDDLWGDPGAKGLRGHLRALLGGRVTTGAVKAIGGAAVALLAGRMLHAGWAMLLAALLIALCANAFNLL